MIAENQPIECEDDFFTPPEPPVYVGWLVISNGLTNRITEWPNRWHRFWMWVLLGWRFEREIDTTIRRYERKPIKPTQWWAPPGCEAAAQALVDAWPQEPDNGTD